MIKEKVILIFNELFNLDGSEIWLAYHAMQIPEMIEGQPDNRTSRVQRLTWGNDSLPLFPLPTGLSVGLDTPRGEPEFLF